MATTGIDFEMDPFFILAYRTVGTGSHRSSVWHDWFSVSCAMAIPKGLCLFPQETKNESTLQAIQAIGKQTSMVPWYHSLQ